MMSYDIATAVFACAKMEMDMISCILATISH